VYQIVGMFHQIRVIVECCAVREIDVLKLISGHVHLHRLSWQKVWTTQLTIREETCIPQLMAWHPEGLFLIVASGKVIINISLILTGILINLLISIWKF